MEFTDKENVPGLMIFIDFQKAFDSVEWDFILGCLEAHLFNGLKHFTKMPKAV